MSRRLLSLVCLLGVLLGVPAAALAAPIEVRAASGALPVELVARGGSFSAKIVVANRGSSPAQVEVALREGSDLDPRLPAGLSAKFAGGGNSARIEPGQEREVEIELSPLKGRRFHEVHGHVLVKTEGAAPVAAGFHAALAGDSGLSGRLLTLSWLVPLLAALALFALRGREPRKGAGRALWAGAMGVEAALLAWGVSRFDVFHTRFSGGEGVQLVERLPLQRGLGVEYYVGVDGVTLVLTLAVALLGLLAALFAEEEHAARFGGFALLIAAGVSGALVSLDLGVMLAFWLVTLVASVAALAKWAADPGLARGAALALGAGFVLVAFAVWQLSATASVAYLLDGSVAPRVFSLTELAHGGFVPKGGQLFGAHPTKVAYVCLFLGSALTLGVAPFGGWLNAVAARAPAPLALLLGGGVTLLGAHALWRIGFAALPAGAQWAALAVAVFGVLATLYASLVALVTDEPRRFAALALSASAGAILIGCGALTAAGLQGAVLLAVSRGLTLALVLGVLSMARAPDGSSLVGGIARGSPMLAALGALAWVGAALGPGTLAFAGVASSLFGALPTLRAVALVEAFALVVLAGAALRSYRKTFLGAGEGPRVPARLAPEREVSAAVVAAILLVVLGFWPRPLLRIIDSSCLDQAEQVNPPGALEVARAPRAAPAPVELASRR